MVQAIGTYLSCLENLLPLLGRHFSKERTAKDPPLSMVLVQVVSIVASNAFSLQGLTNPAVIVEEAF